MGLSVFANNRGIAHKSGSGKKVAAYPDVALTPTAPAPVPIPYANVIDAQAKAGSKKAKKRQKQIMDDSANSGYKGSSATSCSIKSNGDEAGSVGGIKTSVNRGKAEFMNYSSDVRHEGKNVSKMGGHAFHSTKNIVG